MEHQPLAIESQTRRVAPTRCAHVKWQIIQQTHNLGVGVCGFREGDIHAAPSDQEFAEAVEVTCS